MKPFLVGILKCKECSFMTKLTLHVEKADENEIDVDEVRIFNKHMFTENSGERLRSLVCSLRDFQVGVLSSEEIDSFVEDPEDDSRVREFLFGIDVVEGFLRCESCGLQYPIKNSIVETVDVVGSN